MHNTNKIKENNMFKKTLLVTSAIAAAAILSTSAFAEMKLKGSMEYAYSSVDGSTSSVDNQNTNQGKTMGQESNLGVSTSGELDNGIAYYGNFNIEEASEASHEMGFSMDGMSLRFGGDTSGGTEKIKQITPMVNNRRADIFAGTRGQSTACFAGCDVEDVTSGGQYVGLGYKHDLVTLDYAYNPNLSNGTTTDTDKGNGALSGTSGTSWSLKGGFGVEGLTLAYGQNTEKAVAAGAKDAEATIYGAAYKYGQFAIGYQTHENENSAASASRKSSETTDYSVTYSVSDNLSIGYLNSTTDYKSTPTTKAISTDATAVQVGYSLGAVSLHATYADADNAFGTTGRDFSIYKLKAKMAF
jgi:hypothetical protein